MWGSSTSGLKGGETERDEVKTMGLASASILVALTFLNRCYSKGIVLLTTASYKHTYEVHTTVEVITQGVEEDVHKSSQLGATSTLRGYITLKMEVR